MKSVAKRPNLGTLKKEDLSFAERGVSAFDAFPVSLLWDAGAGNWGRAVWSFELLLRNSVLVFVRGRILFATVFHPMPSFLPTLFFGSNGLA